MIIKIEITEKIANIYSSNLSVNVINKNVTYTKGDTNLVNTECDVKREEIDGLIKNYITYWNRDYKGKSSDTDRTVEIVIYTDKNVTTYHFDNAFPEDLEEFIKTLKNMVGIED